MEVCAVGDGANDELMIREAHCGIGIGIEPTADTRTFSDRQVMQHAFNCHEHRDFHCFLQIENFSHLAPFLFEQCPRTLSNELTVVHLLLFKGIVIGMTSLLYTWTIGSSTPLLPESVAFTLNNIFITAAVLIFGFFHSSYPDGVLLKHPGLYRSFGDLSLTTVRRWTAAAFASSLLSLCLLLSAFPDQPPPLHGVLFALFTFTIVLCCAVLCIDDAAFQSGKMKLIALFCVLHILLPVFLWFDLSGSLFMGGPSPAVLAAMRLLFSSHIYVIPACWSSLIFLDWFTGHRHQVRAALGKRPFFYFWCRSSHALDATVEVAHGLKNARVAWSCRALCRR